MLSIFKKKETAVPKASVHVSDDEITAIADAVMIPLEEVKDDAFAQKMMGDVVAFELKEDVVLSPCNGTLSAVFPTGHAYGLTMKNGVELLVHVGINTVSSKGDGFKVLVEQDQKVQAGDPLVKLDMKKLKANYDMTTMLIITDPNEKEIRFIDYGEVEKGQKISR